MEGRKDMGSSVDHRRVEEPGKRDPSLPDSFLSSGISEH